MEMFFPHPRRFWVLGTILDLTQKNESQGIVWKKSLALVRAPVTVHPRFFPFPPIVTTGVYHPPPELPHPPLERIFASSCLKFSSTISFTDTGLLVAILHVLPRSSSICEVEDVLT